MNLGNGRKEIAHKPIEDRSTPLVIPRSMESISREETQKPNSGKSAAFKVYDEPVIVKAGIPIMVSDEAKEIFRLSEDIFKK